MRAGMQVLLLCCFVGCRPAEEQRPAPGQPVRIVFKHPRFPGDPRDLQQVFAAFSVLHPGVRVESEVLLSDTDLQHQFYVTNLEGGSSDFDVMGIDVIWAPEFARAGWLLDLSDRLPPERVKQDFLTGPAEAVTWGGRTWAVPWFADVGLLYYRTDLLAKYGLSPPRSYTELAAAARKVLDGERRQQLKGYVWQGRQYEGLVCAALEAIRGFSGGVLDAEGRVILDRPEAARGLSFLRRLIEQGISPGLTTSADEEVVRNLFNDGNAVFMRNWPYAWALLQREGSPVRGRVAFGPVPAEPGAVGGGTLGGWHLAVNRRSPPWKRDMDWAFIAYLTSPGVQRRMLQAYGLHPSLAALYRDPDFRREEPFAATLLPVMSGARPRPVTPFYLMISQVLQSELSAAVSGIRPPEQALSRAAAEVRFILGQEAQ